MIRNSDGTCRQNSLAGMVGGDMLSLGGKAVAATATTDAGSTPAISPSHFLILAEAVLSIARDINTCGAMSQRVAALREMVEEVKSRTDSWHVYNDNDLRIAVCDSEQEAQRRVDMAMSMAPCAIGGRPITYRIVHHEVPS